MQRRHEAHVVIAGLLGMKPGTQLQQRSHAALFAAMDTALKNHLTALCKMSGKALADQRYKKFRQIGEAKRA